METNTIYDSEIFKASQCLTREAQVSNIIKQCVEDNGFEKTSCHDIYNRGSQRVVLSLVDDIEHVNNDELDDVWQSFSDRDIIITDNYVTRPTAAHIVLLPKSWFGIYAYTPEITVSEPSAAFSMPVNRIDSNRTLIMLAMQWKRLIDRGYVNFNCNPHGYDQDQASQIAAWQNCCEILRPYQGNKYDRIINELSSRMPLRNHNWDLDTMIQHGVLNVVIETYASDVCVSFSEKIFRALQTPRPWIMFAGTWAMSRLHNLGFDIMSDIIDHAQLDHRRMVDHKVVKFVDVIQEFIDNPRDIKTVLTRAHEAAQKNQTLLKTWQKQWWYDFPDFLNQLNTALE